MRHPSPLRPQAKVEIVKQSRDRWKNAAGIFSRALDATSFTLLHGDRQQQIAAANEARDLLAFKGYPVRDSQLLSFTVTARVANVAGIYTWDYIGHSAADAMLDALQKFDGQFVSISVRREAVQ